MRVSTTWSIKLTCSADTGTSISKAPSVAWRTGYGTAASRNPGGGVPVVGSYW